MNVKRNSLSYKNFFASWVVVIISLLKVTNQRIIVTPSPWNYECDEGAGMFPHAFDCQRQDDHPQHLPMTLYKTIINILVFCSRYF
jgi:hypothetical protein